MKPKNAFTPDHVWPAEKLAAWIDMPLGPMGWVAPPTEVHREKWRNWWAKWGKKYHYTPIYDGYKDLDRLKEKQDAEKGRSGGFERRDYRTDTERGEGEGDEGLFP